MNIFVGNLPRKVSEDELRQVFESYGEIASVTIIKDKMTGESRGFGFVEMPSAEQAQAAISALNGTDLGGRTLSVNEARPREARPPRGGMGGDQRRMGGGMGGGRRGGGMGGRRF